MKVPLLRLTWVCKNRKRKKKGNKEGKKEGRKEGRERKNL